MQETFGDFKVLDRVGAGTGSEVFRARDTRAGRTAAIKVLTSDLAMDPVVGAPFVDEAYLAQKLGHPSAATLYDIGEQDGHPHLVYEFIQGQTLTALLAGHPLNPRRALELATQIADALAEAHALGLVHRGLRSDKVMVSLKGNAKVLDFGLGHYAAAIMRQLAAGGGTGAATPVAAPAASSAVASSPGRKTSAPAAAASPKKAPGVTVTAPPPASTAPPAQAAAGNQPGSGKKAGGKKATARPSAPARTSPAVAPRHPAADQTIDVSGLGKTTIVIMLGVAVLMALLYWYFG